MNTQQEEKVTYTEIFLCHPYCTDVIDAQIMDEKPTDKVKMIPISLTESFFNDRLKHIATKNSPYKFFQRSFKSYVFEDLVLENRDGKEGQTFEVYTKRMMNLAFEKEKNLLHVGYYKKKQSFNVFPSTMCLNNIFLTKRLSFLVNSHIYINFDIIYHMNKDKVIDDKFPTFKIFINLNTEKNIDLENARKLIREALAFLTE